MGKYQDGLRADLEEYCRSRIANLASPPITLDQRYNDDGGEQEAAYCDEVTAMVTCDPAELIVDTWLDEFKLDATHDQASPFRLASLRLQLLYVLRANTDELERAENAARLEGGQSFSEWLEER